jgi:all-trans-retinol 13,14-reductase
MEERPDRAVIVGGGIAGLTAGILLAGRGVDVVLVEQHTAIGGYLQGFTRRSVRFETGLHYVGACLPGQAFARYLTLLGVYDDLTFLPAPEGVVGRVILPDRHRVSAPQGMDEFAALAKSEFPHESKGIDAILSEVRRCLNVTPWLDLREKVADLGIHQAYSTLSADAVIRSHVSDPELIAFFSALCFSTAMLPTECPFTLYTVVLCTLLSSCSAIQGGGRQFLSVMRKRFEALGGKLVLGNGASGVVVTEKRLSALVLDDGTQLALDVLISTCHPCETVRFVGRDRFSPSFLENLDSLEMSNGSFKLYVELHKPIAALGKDRWILCDSEWPGGIYMASPSAIDASHGDKHCLDILVWQNFAAVERWSESRRGRRPAEYEAFKKETAQRLLDRVTRDFPEIPSAVKHVYTSTPLTNLDYIRSARGAAMGVRQDIGQQGKRHIRPRGKLRNLFLAGQSVSYPGILGTVVGATELCDGLLGEDVDLFCELQQCSFR